MGSNLDLFGCHVGYVLRVPVPLRQEMFSLFSDTSDITKPTNHHGCLMVLLYQQKSCSRLKSLQHDIKMFPNLVQRRSKHDIGKGVESALAFCMLFGPKMNPKMSPKWLQHWYHTWCAKRALKRHCPKRALFGPTTDRPEIK